MSRAGGVAGAGFCGTGLLDVAVAHMDGAMPVTGCLGIVGDHENGLSETDVQIAQQSQHGIRVDGIEIAGRFIGQQNSRLVHDGARDRHALLLAARKRAGLMI